MPAGEARPRAIVVGAGHNGLVAAGYLARAGWKVLVLERRHLVGGACVTEEVFPGYRVSTAAYLVSLLQERVVRDLELRRFGYEVLPKDPAYFAPYLDGRYLFMYADQRRTCEALARFSRRDAERYPTYERFVERMARFVEPMLLEAPPNLPPRRPADFAALSRLGWRLLRLAPAQLGDLARMFTASAREVLDDWFESDELKLALATDGVIGTNGGPSSPGTAYVLLHHMMGGVGGVRGLWGFVRGGMGALSAALQRSAQAAGADVRTHAEVARIDVRDGRAVGVILADGSDYRARTIVSNADPKRTFLGLIGRACLPPEFVAQIDAYRCEGSSFKINLALGELPNYSALPGTCLGPQHRGTTHICASLEALERAWDDAKYGTPSRAPLLEITIPTAYDPSAPIRATISPLPIANDTFRTAWMAPPGTTPRGGRSSIARSACSSSTRRTSVAPSSTFTRSRRSISNATMGSPAATSFTAICAWISCSGCGRSPAGRVMRRRFEGCTCAARARTRAAG